MKNENGIDKLVDDMEQNQLKRRKEFEEERDRKLTELSMATAEAMRIQNGNVANAVHFMGFRCDNECGCDD